MRKSQPCGFQTGLTQTELHSQGDRHIDCIDCTVTAKLISAFVFTTQIVQFLYFLNPKFLALSFLLCLYSSVCVGPVREPHHHDAAYMCYQYTYSKFYLLHYCHRLYCVALFSQAILCTKEVAERARTAAYNLLVEMGKAVIKWSQDPKGKC